MSRQCLITVDVECTSLINHRLDERTAKLVLKQGMPRLLSLFNRYNVHGTFFYTGKIAELVPDTVRLAYEKGHEIGSHGYSHQVNHAFDILTYQEQIAHLTKSKEILESIIGEKIISFRAPAARVNQNIVRPLLETGFKVDSSISSQRLDMFMSFGAKKKLNWLSAPRLPYFTHPENIFKRGYSELFEIPISAFGFPYIGTSMRISPFLNKVTRSLLHIETKFNGRPFVFLTHPNEYINEERDNQEITRRGKTYISYLLGDILRHKLKVKNLGEKAIPIFEKELLFFIKNDYSFITCKDYYNNRRASYAGK